MGAVVPVGMSNRVHIEQRDISIRAAHSFISSAIHQIDKATVHADEIDDQVHVDRLREIVGYLKDARLPLSHHLDWLDGDET